MSEADDLARPAGLPADADPWQVLRALTPARVALGRAGVSLPTREVLGFGHAHALARDAVHRELDLPRLSAAVSDLGLSTIAVASMAPDRATYLRRPDLGRQLAQDGADLLRTMTHGPVDLAIMVGDGLSATAVQANTAPLLAALLPGIRAAGWQLAPIVLATQARVALGDPVGATLRARLVLVLIGERPGLSSPDSLGAYLTFAPEPGRHDDQRNCVSNIRPAGLTPDRAAAALLWLMSEAFRRSLTGVMLKDESGEPRLGHTVTPDLPAPSEANR